MKKSLPYSYKQSINKQIIKMAEDGTKTFIKKIGYWWWYGRR